MADNVLSIKINGDAKSFLDALDKSKKQTAELEKVLTTTAKVSAAAFAALTAVVVGVTKSYSDYEKALVGVGKTTNIEGARLDKFGKQFQKLSSQIPVATNDLLGIAQAAGQLGVSGEANLLKFTETVAKLGVATDLSGEEAATALTRILNVTNEGIDTIDVFGSVIVRLGNNFAATESEITRMATEVSRASAVFGITAAQSAALGTALKSVGVQAELGGSAIGKSFRTIDEVIRNGGAQLENLERITGMTGEQLKKTFEDDAVGVFQSFIEGIGRVVENGGSASQVLETFGLKGDEINKVLPVLAKNSYLVADALNQAAEETQNATALNEEAAKAFDTLASEGQKTLNNFTNLATNIGATLAPEINNLLKNVNGLLKEVSELDQETLSLIGSFLKWGAIVTGAVASAATLAIGFLKLRQLMSALSIALNVGRIAAVGFTSALTFGLTAVIAFLPEIISGIKSLVGLLKKPEKPQTLEAITSELKKLNEERDRLKANNNFSFRNQAALDSINKEIDKLEELRQAKIKATEDFGTGSLLVRPEADTGVNLGASAFGITEQTVPFAPAAEGGSGNEAIKKSEEDKTKIVDEETQKRIDAQRRANEQLKALELAKGEELLNSDVEFLNRKAAIEEEFAQAKLIKDDEERTLALENLRLKHAEELAAIEEKETLLDELKATKREERAALDEELRALEVEQRDALTQEDLQALQSQVDSENEVKRKAALAEAQRKIKERNQFKADELKYGTEIATIKSFFASQEVQQAREGASQLIQLTNSKNATLKGIGKAAAATNAAIATAEGAIKAYASLAGIPIVGPALGAAAAAALFAYGVEQQQQIAAMATGGFVQNTIGGSRDRVPTMLEPNELVVPSAIAPNFIQAAGVPDTQGREALNNNEDSGTSRIEIMLQDRAGEFISLEQREGRSLGIIGEE